MRHYITGAEVYILGTKMAEVHYYMRGNVCEIWTHNGAIYSNFNQRAATNLFLDEYDNMCSGLDTLGVDYEIKIKKPEHFSSLERKVTQ